MKHYSKKSFLIANVEPVQTSGALNRETCESTGKVCYSKRDAMSICKSGKRDKKKKRGVVPSRCYFCEACKSWHLTHYRKRELSFTEVGRRKMALESEADRKRKMDKHGFDWEIEDYDD